ncbi:hypothetical protein B0H17DRAFT_1208479 [Mycena rosella]|uniref:Uncharacterized protein n=1 Tax=Mycena rosella TaxID=1033263 RepID=A0AAD7D192_MYCRO|nr:hypothetical protein B0H17DRAFT_1208479 [Mycena rosella]
MDVKLEGGEIGDPRVRVGQPSIFFVHRAPLSTSPCTLSLMPSQPPLAPTGTNFEVRDRGTYTVAPKTEPSQQEGLTLVGGKPMLMGCHPVVVAAGRAGKTSSTTGATYAATEACTQISDARRRPPSYDAGLIARALQQTTRRVVLRESQTGMVVGITTGGSAAKETLGSRRTGASLCGNTGLAIGRKRRHNEDHANTEEYTLAQRQLRCSA